MRLTILTISLVASTLAQTPFDIKQLDLNVVEQFREAWSVAGLGNRNTEVVVLILANDDGGYTADIQRGNNEYRKVYFRWNPRTVAVFHTHPNAAPARPSDFTRFGNS